MDLVKSWHDDFVTTNKRMFHIVIYIPKKSHSPLHLYHDEELVGTNGFVIPKVGSLLIFNPQQNTSFDHNEKISQRVISFEEGHRLMQLLIQQLRQLFSINTPQELGGFLRVFPETGISLWELDQFLRNSIFSAMKESEILLNTFPQMSSLQQLSSLSQSISQSIISFNSSVQALQRGDYLAANEFSRDAFMLAKSVMFSEKFLGNLHFPLEYQFAVYSPLCFPVMFAVLRIMILQFKSWLFPKPSKKKNPTH